MRRDYSPRKSKGNGRTITELGFKVDPQKDKVLVDGKKLVPVQKKIYIMLNKPFGVISSAKDEKGRKTVVDLVKDKVDVRVFPVGRLDFDTTGLILLTMMESLHIKLHILNMILKKHILHSLKVCQQKKR